MRALLIYNPTAGDAGHEGEHLLAKLREHGDDVALVSSLDAIHDSEADLLIAAGGDGTVASVVRAIVGRVDTPLLILPVGTANNIARSLGIDRPELDLDVVREKWTARSIDVAMMYDSLIVEGAGCGALPEFMRAVSDNEERDGVRKEKKSFAEVVESMPLFQYRLTLDEQVLEGEALMIEILVLSQIGPNLLLAPDADPGDGLLNVIVAGEEHRQDLTRYLKTRGHRHAPSLTCHRTKTVKLNCDAPWHLDDETIDRTSATIEVRARAWRAMVPRR